VPTSAETPDGTIPFDCPDIPTPKFQFHFTRELIALAVTTAPFTTVDDLYIHIYDDAAGIYDTLAQYYGENLKAKNWHGIQEDDRVQLYVLNGTTMQGTGVDNTFMGIFAVVKGNHEIYLLNIVGNVPAQQAGQLLTDLSKLGIEISELKSLSALEIDKRSLPSPTGFRTAEGFPIHEIQIKGNQKIDRVEILATLEAGDEDINKAVEALRKKMGYRLEGVETSVKQEDGKQIAVITVKERPSQSAGFSGGGPIIQFNRVTGWELGAEIENRFPGARLSDGTLASKLFGNIGYGFGNKLVNYEIGGTTMPFLAYTYRSGTTGHGDPSGKWYLGLGMDAKVYRITDITTPILTVVDDYGSAYYDSPFRLLYSLFGGSDIHNYYSRRGFEIGLRWETLSRPVPTSSPTHLATLTFLVENHESLEKSTDWHLFNWRSTSKARENPAITPGRMRSVMFEYDLNIRRNSLGWHNTFSVEHSSPAFGSDFDFTRYQLHLRYAHPFGKHKIRTRAVGSFSTASLPIQRQFTIGGPGVLNGYPLYAFAGDRGYLFNLEYFYPFPELPVWRNMPFDVDFNLFLVFFLDAGRAWNIDNETSTLVPKSDAGIGFHFGESDSFLRFNVAKAFESEQGVQFNVLWFYSF
jgi:hypothetical protein